MTPRSIKIDIRMIDRELIRLNRKLAACPEGKLWIVQNGKYYSYYYKPEGSTRVYLGKDQRELARRLAYKKYLELKIQDLEAKKEALIHYDEKYLSHFDQAARYLLENEGAARLLRECFPVAEAPLAVWAARPEARDAPYQENRIIECNSGHMVRTKSEALIANTLFEARIPFRYEDPLVLGNETVYPDFTIRHPQTGEYIYWEHFGMVDQLKYKSRWINALNNYASSGYYPFYNLIATTETGDMPLDAGQISVMMDYFF